MHSSRFFPIVTKTNGKELASIPAAADEATPSQSGSGQLAANQAGMTETVKANVSNSAHKVNKSPADPLHSSSKAKLLVLSMGPW